MTTLTCDSVRDLLPDLDSGTLDSAVDGAVLAHVATCHACADELELIRLLRRHAIPVPVGLAKRIVARLEQPETDLEKAREARSSRWPQWVARVPLAASIVFAIVIGSLWWESGRQPSITALDDEATRELAAAILDPFPGWPSTEVHLAGGVVLQNLTDAELEILLTEMEW